MKRSQKLFKSSCIIKLIDWFLFLILCFVSLGLTWEVLEQYQLKSSSFKVYESPITDHPALTFCFTKWRKNGTAYEINLEYKKHFKVRMHYSDCREYDLNLGINEHKGDSIKVEALKTQYSGTCYKITTNLYDKVIPGQYYGMFIYFDDEFLTFESIPSIKVFITSEKNAFGIIANDWRDGKVLEYSLKPCMKTIISIKPIQHIYRKTSSCRDESFYQCFGGHLYRHLHNGCHPKCRAGKAIY